MDIDSVDMCLRLPGDKLFQVRQELSQFAARKHASKKQLQSLAGKLNFWAGVIYSGRVYLRRIINELNRLKADNHKAILCGSIKQISLGGRISWLLSMENQCSLIKFLLSLFSLIVVTWQQGASLMVTGFTAAGNVTGPWCQNYI